MRICGVLVLLLHQHGHADEQNLAGTAGLLVEAGWSCLLLTLPWTHSAELFLGRKLQAAHANRFYLHMMFHIFCQRLVPVAVSGRLRRRKQLRMFMDWLMIITGPMTSTEGNFISASHYTGCVRSARNAIDVGAIIFSTRCVI